MKKIVSLLAVISAFMMFGCTNVAIQEVAGEFFIAGDMGYGFEAYTAPEGVVFCFVPAQLETVNNGEPFCFSNTDEAEGMLKCHEEGSLCSGPVVVEIEELPETAPLSKDDECVIGGNCVPVVTELKSVVEFL